MILEEALSLEQVGLPGWEEPVSWFARSWGVSHGCGRSVLNLAQSGQSEQLVMVIVGWMDPP